LIYGCHPWIKSLDIWVVGVIYWSIMYSFPLYMFDYIWKTQKFNFSFCFSFILHRFCGVIFCKPAWDHTCPLREHRDFKGLVARTKCNRDFYESELGILVILCFIFFTRGRAKSWHQSIYLVIEILYLHSPGF